MKDNMNRREFSKRLGMVVGGTALAIIGVPLLVLPGSGMAFILVGVGLVGGGIGVDVRGKLKKVARKRMSKAEKNFGTGNGTGRSSAPDGGGQA